MKTSIKKTGIIKSVFVLMLLLLIGCENDDDTNNNCIVCNNFINPLTDEFISTAELCRGANGNLFADGEDLGIPYDQDVVAFIQEECN